MRIPSYFMLICLMATSLQAQLYHAQWLEVPREALAKVIGEDEEVVNFEATQLSECGAVAGALHTHNTSYTWVYHNGEWEVFDARFGTALTSRQIQLNLFNEHGSLLLMAKDPSVNGDRFIQYYAPTGMCVCLDELSDGACYLPSILRNDGAIVGTYSHKTEKKTVHGLFAYNADSGLIKLPMSMQKWPLVGKEWIPFTVMSTDGERFLIRFINKYDETESHFRVVEGMEDLFTTNPQDWTVLHTDFMGPLHFIATAGELAVGYWDSTDYGHEDFLEGYREQAIAMNFSGHLHLQSRFPRSHGLDCNSSHVVVGTYGQEGEQAGFIWTPEDGYHQTLNLNDHLDTESQETLYIHGALKINEAGFILAEARRYENSFGFALLVPLEE